MNASALAELVAHLWPQGESLTGPQAFAVIDGARDARIEALLRDTGLEQSCLFAGPLTPALRAAAPRLVRLSPQAALTRALFELGWSDHWFVVLRVDADVTLQQLHRHLRTLLRVRDEQGRVFMFRFYDPRVLRPYLPSCSTAEAKVVFGPISEFCCAGYGSSSMIRFARSSAGVVSTTWQPGLAAHEH